MNLFKPNLANTEDGRQYIDMNVNINIYKQIITKTLGHNIEYFQLVIL